MQDVLCTIYQRQQTKKNICVRHTFGMQPIFRFIFIFAFVLFRFIFAFFFCYFKTTFGLETYIFFFFRFRFFERRNNRNDRRNNSQIFKKKKNFTVPRTFYTCKV